MCVADTMIFRSVLLQSYLPCYEVLLHVGSIFHQDKSLHTPNWMRLQMHNCVGQVRWGQFHPGRWRVDIEHRGSFSELYQISYKQCYLKLRIVKIA